MLACGVQVPVLLRAISGPAEILFACFGAGAGAYDVRVFTRIRGLVHTAGFVSAQQ